MYGEGTLHDIVIIVMKYCMTLWREVCAYYYALLDKGTSHKQDQEGGPEVCECGRQVSYDVRHGGPWPRHRVPPTPAQGRPQAHARAMFGGGSKI